MNFCHILSFFDFFCLFKQVNIKQYIIIMQLYLIRYLQNNLITLMLTLCWHFCNREGKLLRKLKTKILGGTTMKKFSTRLIALVMALTLVMSCGVFASAAEAEAVPDGNEEVIKLPPSPNVASPMGKVVTIAGGELVDKEKGAKFSDTINLSEEGYIILQFAVIGKCRLKVTVRNGIFWKDLCDEVYEDTSFSKITDRTYPGGTEITYTLTAEGHVDDAVLVVKMETA